ncbi:MAG: hypothetical protein IIC85_01635 [Chloroflexi bacterium]|nr:hypothetical protein [Chloroflexota bacterium]
MGYFDIQTAGRRRRQTGSRFAVYLSELHKGRAIKGISAGLYFEGTCTEERLKEEVLPKVREHFQYYPNRHFPICVEGYLSKSPGINEWVRGERRKPDDRTRHMQFFVDEQGQIYTVMNNGTISPSNES